MSDFSDLVQSGVLKTCHPTYKIPKFQIAEYQKLKMTLSFSTIFFKLGSNVESVSPLFFSVLNHSGFLFLWYSSIFHGVTTHADFHAFLESAKLTSVSVHSQNLARTILWTLTICQLVAYCSAEKSL